MVTTSTESNFCLAEQPNKNTSHKVASGISHGVLLYLLQGKSNLARKSYQNLTRDPKNASAFLLRKTRNLLHVFRRSTTKTCHRHVFSAQDDARERRARYGITMLIDKCSIPDKSKFETFCLVDALGYRCPPSISTAFLPWITTVRSSGKYSSGKCTMISSFSSTVCRDLTSTLATPTPVFSAKQAACAAA